MKICVFCSANEKIDPDFFRETEALGTWAAKNGHSIVFGGHDSFLREIRQKLPDITYVSTRLYNFDPNIIRNADVVWIQNNAISHPQYWRVVRISKIYGVQIRYFAYASAEKCAEMLAEWDIKDE